MSRLSLKELFQRVHEDSAVCVCFFVGGRGGGGCLGVRIQCFGLSACGFVWGLWSCLAEKKHRAPPAIKLWAMGFGDLTEGVLVKGLV